MRAHTPTRGGGQGEDRQGFIEDVMYELNPEVSTSFLRERIAREKGLVL